MVGYNYRMTNLAAAIGLAQLEKIDWHLAQRLQVAQWYREELRDCPGLSLQPEAAWAKHVYWMVTVLLDHATEEQRDKLMIFLRAAGIETRPVFYPMHRLPPYRQPGIAPVAESIAARGFNVPTWGGLTRKDVRYVCAKLRAGLNEASLQ